VRVSWLGEEMLLRPAEATDRSFVFATWMRSYREVQKHIAYEAYHTGQGRRVERLWKSSMVACRESAPDTIHAWVCGSPGLLHYVYVPPTLRRKGLAKALVDQVCGKPLDFTHRWPFPTLPHGWRPNEYRLEES
jgi:GNAT superfamily N-acetyltransferase